MIINAVLDFDFTSIPERNRKNVGIGTTANSKNIVNNLSEKEKQIEQLNKENNLLKEELEMFDGKKKNIISFEEFDDQLLNEAFRLIIARCQRPEPVEFDLWNEIKAHIDSLSDLDFIQFVNSINNYKLSSNNLIDEDRQEKNMDNPDNNYIHEVAQEEKKEKLPGLEDGVV